MNLIKLVLSILAVTSVAAHAEQVNVNAAPESSIDPQICEMSYTAKVPFCTIKVTTTSGTRVGASYFEHSKKATYEDTVELTLGELNPSMKKFEINPLVMTFEADGSKYLRLMFAGKLDPSMTAQEEHGRLAVMFEKDGSSPQAFTLPVFFTTANNQKFEVAKATVGTTTSFAGFRYPNNLTTLTITNSGNGVLAIKGIAFTKKPNSDYQYSDFATVSANVMPHATAIIPIYEKATAEKLKNASSIILSNKRKTEYIDVSIAK